jgi:hypothetical protein
MEKETAWRHIVTPDEPQLSTAEIASLLQHLERMEERGWSNKKGSPLKRQWTQLTIFPLGSGVFRWRGSNASSWTIVFVNAQAHCFQLYASFTNHRDYKAALSRLWPNRRFIRLPLPPAPLNISHELTTTTPAPGTPASTSPASTLPFVSNKNLDPKFERDFI